MNLDLFNKLIALIGYYYNDTDVLQVCVTLLKKEIPPYYISFLNSLVENGQLDINYVYDQAPVNFFKKADDFVCIQDNIIKPTDVCVHLYKVLRCFNA